MTIGMVAILIIGATSRLSFAPWRQFSRLDRRRQADVGILVMAIVTIFIMGFFFDVWRSC